MIDVDITSSDNRQVKEVRKLQRRRHRYREQSFVLEGVRLIQDALQATIELQRLFYAPAMILDNEAAQQIVANCQNGGIPALSCTPEVMSTLADTVTPQGLVAVATMPELVLPDPLQFTLILDRVRDPGNAGTLLRTAAAAGIDAVIFGPETVDPFNDKVIRAGMGAHFRLPLRICATWAEIHALLAPGQQCYVAEVRAEQSYITVDWTLPNALIVGGEAAGASAEGVAAATPIAIPMASQVESLNAATAGAIILFEAVRQRQASLPKTPVLSQSDG